MRWLKWTGIIAAVLLVVACFGTWVIITSKDITVTGVNTTGTNFGKPAYLHFVFTAFFLVFTLMNSVLAKRFNLFVTAVNLGWAVRNYFIVSLCRAGECPEKKLAIYFVVIASIIMLVSAMFPHVVTRDKKLSV